MGKLCLESKQKYLLHLFLIVGYFYGSALPSAAQEEPHHNLAAMDQQGRLFTVDHGPKTSIEKGKLRRDARLRCFERDRSPRLLTVLAANDGLEINGLWIGPGDQFLVLGRFSGDLYQDGEWVTSLEEIRHFLLVINDLGEYSRLIILEPDLYGVPQNLTVNDYGEFELLTRQPFYGKKETFSEPALFSRWIVDGDGTLTPVGQHVLEIPLESMAPHWWDRAVEEPTPPGPPSPPPNPVTVPEDDSEDPNG